VCDDKPYVVSSQYGFDFVPRFLLLKQKRDSQVGEWFDKKAIEKFTDKISTLRNIFKLPGFSPQEQVPLLKAGEAPEKLEARVASITTEKRGSPRKNPNQSHKCD